MIGLFSIYPIIREHFKSLVDDSTVPGVIILFFILPVAIAISAVGLESYIAESFVQTSLSVLAVLVGFTINALVLLMGTSQESFTNTQVKVLKKTRNHTIYSLVIGLLLLAMTGLLFMFYSEIGSWGNNLLSAISFIVYAISIHYIITLFLIPARIYKISDLD